MKELSIEEKAKRYDELKVTAQELEHDGCFDKITLFDLFPELKESEDERIRKDIVFYIAANHKDDGEKTRWLYWLERQGEQNLANSAKTCKDEQKPVEWSEEDRIKCNGAIHLLENLIKEGYFDRGSDDVQVASDLKFACKGLINWLKSLRPQNTWKPSDEQMITLRHVISGCSYDIEPLVEIEEHLKKLREK